MLIFRLNDSTIQLFDDLYFKVKKYGKNRVVCQDKNEHFILWRCEDGRMLNNKGGPESGRNLGC